MNFFTSKIDKKKLVLQALDKYRCFLLACHGYPSKGVMQAGNVCVVEDPTKEVTHEDIVHPCVRYIEEGFEGHKWWMVYTPYYGGNEKLENPRLCYSDASEGELPTDWRFYCNISERPEIGYNSDPTMLFHHGELYVFWRENDTPKAKDHGCVRITVGGRVHNHQVINFTEPQLTEISTFIDKEVCPTIIERNGTFRAYSVHIDFVPSYIRCIPSKLGSLFYRYNIVNVIDSLGFYDLCNCYGVAIWDSNSLCKTFRYINTVQFENKPKLYQPWHMDVFKSEEDQNEAIYAVVQTRIKNARICLAKSDNGEKFRFYKKPLITSKTLGMIGLYKPTAIKVGDKFYLFYTVRDNKDFKLNKLFVSSIDWDSLLKNINI